MDAEAAHWKLLAERKLASLPADAPLVERVMCALTIASEGDMEHGPAFTYTQVAEIAGCTRDEAEDVLTRDQGQASVFEQEAVRDDGGWR